MLTITQENNALIVKGQSNGLYPDNGTNSYPLNSISLVVDESDIATFRSAATNDVLFSGKIDEITIGGNAVTKDTIFAAFDAVANSSSGGGGGGGDVDLSDYYTKEETDEKLTEVDTAISQKQNKLVSGTNIRTVNSQSLVGSGNVVIPVMTDAERKKLNNAADGKTYRTLMFDTPAVSHSTHGYYYQPYKRSSTFADTIEMSKPQDTALSVWQEYFMKVSGGAPFNGNGFEMWYPCQFGNFSGGSITFGGLKLTTTYGSSGMGMSEGTKSKITIEVVDSNGEAAQSYYECRIYVGTELVKGIYDYSSVTFEAYDIVTFLNENGGGMAPSISASLTEDNLNSGIWSWSDTYYCFKNCDYNGEPFFGYDEQGVKASFGSGGGGGDLSDYYNKSQVDTKLAAKQDKLVSGTNIKTVNSQSLLGSGNIKIDGISATDANDKFTTKSTTGELAIASPIHVTVATEDIPRFNGLYYSPLKGTSNSYDFTEAPNVSGAVGALSPRNAFNDDGTVDLSKLKLWSLFRNEYYRDKGDTYIKTIDATLNYGNKLRQLKLSYDPRSELFTFESTNDFNFVKVYINGEVFTWNSGNVVFSFKPGDIVAIQAPSGVTAANVGTSLFSGRLNSLCEYGMDFSDLAPNDGAILYSVENGVKTDLYPVEGGSNEWTGTQSEYDALDTKDSDTTYFVTD